MINVFYRERAEEVSKNQNNKAEVLLTEEKILNLPEPIKKYLNICGYLNRPMIYNADIVWKNSFIKLKPDKDWMELETKQFNSVNPPARIAYMKFLSMPVSGRDIYRNGQGEMKGKLLNLFTVINAKGKEVSQSALITVFCEFLIIPGYIFQEYVTWEYIDDKAVAARLTDKGYDVKGVFYFDEKGLFSKFETNDRYYTWKGKTEKVKFSVTVDSYQTIDSIRIPKDVKVAWHLNDCDYEYYKGSIEKIVFNINK